MSNGHMLVTFGAIEQAASDTDSIAALISQELQDLRTYLQPLISTWEGKASADWQVLQNKWDTSAQDLQAILQTIASNLRVAASNYVNTENANASMWG